MAPDWRPDRISDLYHAALKRPPADRSAFLAATCGDDAALRQEVESLLACDAASGPFLEASAAVAFGRAAVGQTMIGQTLGSFRVLGKLGEGGMGEVYRAHDTKLGRDVAIKILPPHFTADPERRLRFAREARTLATLNHPHIGAIYGLEESDGLAAIVLEFVEGATLADRLERGPLKLGEALAIARQVADAVDAAHQKGIIHRDLKPANIMLQSTAASSDVRTKVLDFGLAKTAPESGAPQGTLTSAATEDGRILGTPAYMSPEQARAETVDKRTDIWAFGCVLYEMLAGRRAFEGKTSTDTLAYVLEREPDWSALPATTPETVRKLLRRCLVKDPSQRLRDIGDVRLELDDVALDATARQADTGPSTTRRLLVAAFVVLVVSAVIWGAKQFATGSRPPTVAETSTARSAEQGNLTRLTFDEGLQTDPALSPDASFVVYSANPQGNFDIYNRPVGDGNAVQVTTHPAHDWQPDVSVKNQIVFRSERDGGGLYVVAQTGGHEQRIVSFGHYPLWSPDGTQVLFSRLPRNAMYVVRADGSSTATEVLGPGTAGAYGWFSDASHISTLSTGTTPEGLTPRLRVIDLEKSSTDEWSVAPGVVAGFRDLGLIVRFPVAPLAWSADSRVLYFAGTVRDVSAIWAVDVDPGARVVTGGPHRVAQTGEGVSIARATGAISFAVTERIPRIWWYPLDASGRRLAGPPRPLTAAQTVSGDASVTPDGRLLAYSVSQPAGQAGTEIRTMTLPEGIERTIRVSNTARGESRMFIRPSPNGSYLAFRYIAPRSEAQPDAQRPQDVRVKDLATGDEARLTATKIGAVRPNGWSNDGRYLVVTMSRQRLDGKSQGMAIALLPLAAAPEAEKQIKIVTQSRSALHQPVLSPNGRWMAFIKGSVFRLAIVRSADGVWDAPQDESAWRDIDEDPANQDKPRWSHDGRLLYYTSERGGLLNVWAVDFDPESGPRGRPFPITQFNSPGEQIHPEVTQIEIGVAPGGLLLPIIRPTGGIWLLHPPR